MEFRWLSIHNKLETIESGPEDSPDMVEYINDLQFFTTEDYEDPRYDVHSLFSDVNLVHNNMYFAVYVTTDYSGSTKYVNGLTVVDIFETLAEAENAIRAIKEYAAGNGSKEDRLLIGKRNYDTFNWSSAMEKVKTVDYKILRYVDKKIS